MLKVSEIQMQTSEGRLSLSAAEGMTLGKDGAMTIALDEHAFSVPENSGLFSDWITASDAKALILGIDRKALLDAIKTQAITTFNTIPVAQRTIEERDAVKALVVGLHGTTDDAALLAMGRKGVSRIFSRGTDPDSRDGRFNALLDKTAQLTPERKTRAEAFRTAMRVITTAVLPMIPDRAMPVLDEPVVAETPKAPQAVEGGVPDLDFDDILGAPPAAPAPKTPRFIAPAPSGSPTFLKEAPSAPKAPETARGVVPATTVSANDPGYRKWRMTDGSVINMTELETPDLIAIKKIKNGEKDDLVNIRKAMQAKEILATRLKMERRADKNADQPTLPFDTEVKVAAPLAAAIAGLNIENDEDIADFGNPDFGNDEPRETPAALDIQEDAQDVDFGDPDFGNDEIREDAPAYPVVDDEPFADFTNAPAQAAPAAVQTAEPAEEDYAFPDFSDDTGSADVNEDEDIPDFESEEAEKKQTASSAFPDEIDFEVPDWG